MSIAATVFDVSVPEAPKVVAQHTFNGESLWVWKASVGLRRGFLLVGGVDWNLHVLDVSTPESPKAHERVNLREWGGATGVAVSGEHTVVLAGLGPEAKLLVLAPPAPTARAGTPAAPDVIGWTALPDSVWPVFAEDLLVADGDYAFIAGGSEPGLLVVDVGDPAAPRLVTAVGE